MRIKSPLFRASYGLILAFGGATPALAAYNQQFIVETGTRDELPAGSITFALPDGTSLPTKKDDDGDSVIIFPGDRSEPGTMTVAVPGTPVRTIPFPGVLPGRTIVFDVPAGTARTIPDRSPPPSRDASPPRTHSLVPFGGYGRFGLPAVGAGTLILPGTEVFAAETDDHVNVPFGGLQYSYTSTGLNFQLQAGYGEGSDSASNSTPAGPNGVGIVFTDFAPSGSTGLFLGSSALETGIDRKFTNFSSNATLLFPLNDQGNLKGGFFLGVEIYNTNIDAVITSPTFGTSIMSSLDQELSQDDISFGVTLDYTFGSYTQGSTGAQSGPAFSIAASVFAVHRDVDLSSLQVVRCDICGQADRNFTIEVHDADKGFSVGAAAQASVSIPVSDDVLIHFGIGATYRDKVAGIVNPRTGDDLFIRGEPTAIGYRSYVDLMATFGIGFSF